MTDVMNENALRWVIECLVELADPEFQQRVWVRGQGPEVSSYAEVTCQLFDDTGLGDLLDGGRATVVLGLEATEELRRLRELVDSVPSDIEAESLLRLPIWGEIVQAASRARRLLDGSTAA